MIGHDVFFNYEDFDSEIRKKLRTLSMGSNKLFAQLISECLLRTGDCIDVRKIQLFYEHLLQFDFHKIYPNYLNHPIRVTASYLRLEMEALTTEDVIFGLCHNAIEAGVLDKLDRLFVTDDVVQRIEKITIDRSREEQISYRSIFYKSILEYSNSLFMFKALDKLDNIFWWVKHDLAKYHVDVLFEEVIPVVSKIDPKLGQYLNRLATYVLSPEVKDLFSKELG